ncbi:MAG: hypothetical protein WCV93_05075 [Candidatus Shapirobacteria bacterium]|jgi:FMN phosphatase YigB (HAD superfamily)
MKYQAAFWDFAGVWSKDWFYKSLETSHPDVWKFIQTKIWGPNDDHRVEKWVRGELTTNDINRIISQGTGIDFEFLTKTFHDDFASMTMETRHVPIVMALKQKGLKVGMITDNMKEFSSITVPKHNLLELFDGHVYNSFDYRMLKAEGLLNLAVEQTNAGYNTSLLIDDSPRARAAFEARGGHTYSYTTFEIFNDWANQNLLI